MKTNGARALSAKAGHILRKSGNLMHRIASYLERSTEDAEMARWFADGGDKTLRLFYDRLNQNALVYDVGGYEGQWASDMYSIYRCHIHVFEPVPSFAENMRKRFVQNSDIVVHDFALSDVTRLSEMKVDKNRSSFFQPGDGLIEVRSICAGDFLRKQDITFIDLMKVNIEGSEYDLLEHLIDTGWVNKIGNIQIQFHPFVQNAQRRMRDIQQKLQITHELSYQYLFVWENWRLKLT